MPDNQQILVYLPFEQTETIAALLSRFSPQSFICFHPEVRKRSEWRNIRFEPQAREGFKLALAGCRGVISNAGFELASEALSLGQEAAGQTLGGQFEQLTNGRTLELMGLAQLMDSLDANAVRSWLEALLLAGYAIPMWQESWPTGCWPGPGEGGGALPPPLGQDPLSGGGV